MAYTNEAAYDAYRTATEAYLAAKARRLELLKQANEMADLVYNPVFCNGRSRSACIAEVKQMQAPQEEEIARLEKTIPEQQSIADREYRAWQGLAPVK